MNAQQQIHDSLFGQPITKAALYAYLYLSRKASCCRSTEHELRVSWSARADAIASRFHIRDLILRYRNAAPVN